MTVYTEQDFQDVKRQKNKRLLLFFIPAVLLAAGVIMSFILRIKLLTMGLTIVLGAYCIFTFELYLAPVIAYGKHIDNALHGRTRSLTGAFKEIDQTSVVRDGVKYFPMLLSVGDMDDPEDDRLYYYDCNLPIPDWQAGEMLTVTAHDKALTAWTRANDAKGA